MRRKFQLDRDNRKLAGVCAGIADYAGWDVTLRVGLVLVTLLGLFPWTLIAYGIAAFVAKDRAPAAAAAGPARVKSSTYEIKRSMRDIDRRMAEVEQYVTTSNSGLAREIDSLR
jgi:phage shock protein C